MLRAELAFLVCFGKKNSWHCNFFINHRMLQISKGNLSFMISSDCKLLKKKGDTNIQSRNKILKQMPFSVWLFLSEFCVNACAPGLMSTSKPIYTVPVWKQVCTHVECHKTYCISNVTFLQPGQQEGWDTYHWRLHERLVTQKKVRTATPLRSICWQQSQLNRTLSLGWG